QLSSNVGKIGMLHCSHGPHYSYRLPDSISIDAIAPRPPGYRLIRRSSLHGSPDALGSDQKAVRELACVCSDGAATCPLVRSRPSREARKRLCQHEHGGGEGVLAAAKAVAASDECC